MNDADKVKGNLSKSDLSGIPLADILPSWALYPDFERVEWINTIISRCWPTLAQHFEATVKDKLQAKVLLTSFSYKLLYQIFKGVLLSTSILFCICLLDKVYHRCTCRTKSC